MKLLAFLPFVGRRRRPVPESRRAAAEPPGPGQGEAPRELARRLLAAMPPQQRDALRLHFRMRWPLAAIARHLGLTPLQAAGLIWRGARALEREFPPADPNPAGT